MSAWSALLPVAMVGTERQALTTPSLPGEIGELIQHLSLNSDTAALGVLRIAAVLATTAQAGVQGVPWAEPLPAPASAELLPAPHDPSLLVLLGWVLREGPARLQHLALHWLARRNYRLPKDLLPTALELGRRSVALRTALLPALGERGLWLAAQNPAWNFAAGAASEADEAVRWTEGSLAQRRALLRAERGQDPAAGRERLNQVMGELPARERAELLSELAVGLSMDDEAMLDALRRDRAREVRQVVLGLLLQLPDCAHAQRAGQRLAALLKQERHFFKKKWMLDAPSAVGDDWKADGIEVARPNQESLGERAWWLYQLARQIAPAWWSRHTGLTPAELVSWAIAGDWAEALLRAWRDALSLAPDPIWCEALLDGCPRNHLPENGYVALLALLPPVKRERYWAGHLQAATSAATALRQVVPQVLEACPPGERLSAPLSTALVDKVTEAARTPGFLNDYYLRNALLDLYCVVHVLTLPALTQLPRHADETGSLAEFWHSTTQIMATRQAMNS